MGSKGWQCPNCGHCYAPWISECSQCNDSGDTSNRTNLYEEYRLCPRCYRYHISGPCPDLETDHSREYIIT
jgi:hypothetical protein